MAISWTKEQKQVIDLRDCNLLVSAAAGSGKTAVLVHRILERVLEESHPLELDRLIVVTFTKAAAAEMRDRIRSTFEQLLEQQPDHARLRQQYGMVHQARICTIDSFCSYIVKNYFHVADFDPAFRIADAGELELIKRTVVEELLEEAFESMTPTFQQFVEFFAYDSDDTSLEDLILKVSTHAESHPNPEQWLEEAVQYYEYADFATLLESPFGAYVNELTNVNSLRQVASYAEKGMWLCDQLEGPIYYKEFFAVAAYHANQIVNCQSILERETYIRTCELPAVRKTTKGYLLNLVEEAAYFVERIKELFDQAKKDCLDVSENVDKLTKLCVDPLRELIRLTKQFARKFHEKKQEKKIMDFSDLEHAALQILTNSDGTPSETARSLQEYYQEILIDEYQDSNLLQEAILMAITRQTDHSGNLFMVGDVKQSIYRFRQARPDLFLDKQTHYVLAESGVSTAKSHKVFLHKNFRSRQEVVDSVNITFQSCMRQEIGGIEYDEKEALYLGAQFPEHPVDPTAYRSEVLYSVRPQKATYSTAELEAAIIIQRISQMMDPKKPFLVTEQGQLRPVCYRDMVILLRNRGNLSDTLVEQLMNAGIPAYAESVTGFYNTREIANVVNYLYLLDNQEQDLPLAAVLHSPFAGLDSEDLATIRVACPDQPFYVATEQYAIYGQKPELKLRLEVFYQQLHHYRSQLADTGIHDLLWRIFQETGIYEYYRAMPGGVVRQANLNRLLNQALAYEKTSYKGLYHFVRYLEQIKKNEIEIGEANVISESVDAVRIMTMHKSKGLEFPVVFVAGLDHRFNELDERASLLIHGELGIAVDAVDSKNRMTCPTIQKQILQKKLHKEARAEEMRILYVAMTRAKEKLILTSVTSGKGQVEAVGEAVDEYTIMNGTSYWKWLRKIVGGHADAFQVEEINMELLENVLEETAIERKHPEEEARLENALLDVLVDDTYKRQLQRQMEDQYETEPYYPLKLSVSDLKKQSYPEEYQLHEEREETKELFASKEAGEKPFPRFAKGEQKNLPALRGTAYHKAMECLDYGSDLNELTMDAYIQILAKTGQIDSDVASEIESREILKFLHSHIGQRAKEADARGSLHREQPFMLVIKANTIYEELEDTAAPIIVQGIIDLYFEDPDGQLVLVDYKTDRVSNQGGEEKLIALYRVQMAYYATALEQLTGKKVKEKIIYSFALGREILLPE